LPASTSASRRDIDFRDLHFAGIGKHDDGPLVSEIDDVARPDMTKGIGTAHWNVEAHSASEGVPAGLSVVEGGSIPYQPWALAKRNEKLSKPAHGRSAEEVLHARRAARHVPAVSL